MLNISAPQNVYTNSSVSGALVLDCSTYNVFVLTLTGNATLSLNDTRAGETYSVVIIQGGLGGFTVTWTGILGETAPSTPAGSISSFQLIAIDNEGAAYQTSPGSGQGATVYAMGNISALAVLSAGSGISPTIGTVGTGGYILTCTTAFAAADVVITASINSIAQANSTIGWEVTGAGEITVQTKGAGVDAARAFSIVVTKIPA